MVVTTIDAMPTVRPVESARSGCTATDRRVKRTVASTHSVACMTVSDRAARSARRRSRDVGSRSSRAHRWARTVRRVPHVAPTSTASPT
jgi:hypothetical protein